MPALARNALYQCWDCQALFVDPPASACGMWVDPVMGAWTDAPCVHCGNKVMRVLGKLPLLQLEGDEVPKVERRIAAGPPRTSKELTPKARLFDARK